jgi:hypothetical protein
MPKRVRRDDEECKAFGFRWGIKVRVKSLPDGHKALMVETDFDMIQVYASGKGRRLRVFRGDKELKEV